MEIPQIMIAEYSIIKEKKELWSLGLIMTEQKIFPGLDSILQILSMSSRKSF